MMKVSEEKNISILTCEKKSPWLKKCQNDQIILSVFKSLIKDMHAEEENLNTEEND